MPHVLKKSNEFIYPNLDENGEIGNGGVCVCTA